MDQAQWSRGRAAELAYHSQCSKRSDRDRWFELSRRLFDGLGVDRTVSGKRILDIGCGPALRTRVFVEKNEVVGLDPLIGEYLKLPFCDVGEIEHYNSTAEDFVPQLENRFDIAFCLNVLDHCHRPRLVLKRAGQYLKQGGLLYLWTDIGSCDDIHDGDMTVAEIIGWLKAAGFDILRVTEGVDPQNFGETDQPNYIRCGVPCGPGISCVVVKAIRIREPANGDLESEEGILPNRLEILESRIATLSRRLKYFEERQRRMDSFRGIMSVLTQPVRKLTPLKLLRLCKRKILAPLR